MFAVTNICFLSPNICASYDCADNYVNCNSCVTIAQL